MACTWVLSCADLPALKANWRSIAFWGIYLCFNLLLTDIKHFKRMSIDNTTLRTWESGKNLSGRKVRKQNKNHKSAEGPRGKVGSEVKRDLLNQSSKKTSIRWIPARTKGLSTKKKITNSLFVYQGWIQQRRGNRLQIKENNRGRLTAFMNGNWRKRHWSWK